MNLSKMHNRILLAVLFSVFAAGCQQGMIPPDVVVSRTPFSSTIFPPTSVPTAIPTSILLPSTSVPSVTPARVSLTPTPDMYYQLTYVATCQEESQCMYAIEIGCLETENPCMGESHLLFEITKNGQGPRPPILSYGWSPDGQQIAIEATGLGGKGDVYIGEWDGEIWINLTDSPNYEGRPVWSPDGMHIAYTANTGDPDYIVRYFSIRPDGTEVSQLLSTLNFLDVGYLIWLPDGERVAFLHSDEMGYWQIFVANQDGSNLAQVTRETKDHGLSGVSPDGQWILFTLETEMGSAISNIYLIQPDGNATIAVTDETQGYRSSPVWSPMGDWIAFTAKIDGNYDIFLIRSDGTGLVNVTQSVSDEHAPAWRVVSP